MNILINKEYRDKIQEYSLFFQEKEGIIHMNQLVLAGYLAKDPELTYTPNGHAKCIIRLAVDSDEKDGDTGEYKTDFIDVIAWRKEAENAGNHLLKGRFVVVDAKVKPRSYENSEGKRVYVTDIVANRIQYGPKPALQQA
ncbi:single-stranded DNA-binding protein [Cytobacillus sp. FJAT-54145]|uniref:Single-stranded DNA-binding protein n=1 Tax=Cytobacillus spartinae TaxID=3299023 RepID=A0ABW6KBN2_9BACI